MVYISSPKHGACAPRGLILSLVLAHGAPHEELGVGWNGTKQEQAAGWLAEGGRGRAGRRSAFSVALFPLHAVVEAGRPELLLLNNAGKTPQCVQVGVRRDRGEYGDAAEAKREEN